MHVPEKQDEVSKEIEREKPVLTESKIVEVLNLLQETVEAVIECGPVMTRSLKFKHECKLAIHLFKELYKDSM